VTRHNDPSDGRLVRVRLTSTGRRRIDAAFSALLDTERDLLGALPDAKRAELVDALRDLLLAANTPAVT
jgi:DNA-binding MarR family transcriptional regulator